MAGVRPGEKVSHPKKSSMGVGLAGRAPRFGPAAQKERPVVVGGGPEGSSAKVERQGGGVGWGPIANKK
jgi:hypothetical protein